jgi:hypothetical protein
MALMKLDVARDAVVAASIVYIDHLCSFNVLNHPVVHRARLDLSAAVSEYHKAAIEARDVFVQENKADEKAS